MNAEILCVGTEILLGDIVNTNAAYIAKELAACGIGCYYQTVVGDNPERLKGSVSLAFSRADVVIMTGGLGPTYDDLTKETVAGYFGREMELHQPSLDRMTEVFKNSARPMTDNNKKQAMMPEGAVIFPNDRGTAPGLAVEDKEKNKYAILMPGPPKEMTHMFDAYVRPYLLGLSNITLVSRTIHFYGLGESHIEAQLREYMEEHSNPTIAPYAKEGEVQVRVTASAPTIAEAERMIQPVVEEIQRRFPDNIFGVDVLSLENALIEELAKKGKQIATAESCTGGLVSKRITAISGASRVFSCGVCSYSNEMKTQLLGVPQEILETHGAVSPETAAAMAEGVRKLSGADIGVSITGIAGPEGGTKEKPVGLVYVAVSTETGTEVEEKLVARRYDNERLFIRSASASHALYMALQAARRA